MTATTTTVAAIRATTRSGRSDAEIGQGLLVTEEGRIPFYNFLSDAEMRLFATKPKEVTA